MKIIPAKKEDSDWLNQIIKAEFPYTEFNKSRINEKISDQNFDILIAKQENIYVGFCETEFFPLKKEARLNAIFVEDAWRGQGIAKAMIDQAINDCKHKKIQRIFLLVKEGNTAAKSLYKKKDFVFVGMHDKIIDDSNIEVWEKKI